MADFPAKISGLILASALGFPLAVLAGSQGANAEDTDPTLIHSSDGLSVRWHLQAGLNGVSEGNLFWNFADTFAPGSGFDSDASWLEGYIKPGLSFERTFENGAALYGKLSGVASFTAGTDAYDAADTGRITLEEGYLGFRSQLTSDFGIDLSVGPRELKLGTGMLIANGGSSGFERGALKLGPRKAWEMAAIARLTGGPVTGTLFYIDPNEMPSNDSGNELAGVDVRYDDPAGGNIGVTYVNVIDSRAPYPQAALGGVGPPVVTPGAREGLNAINFYARTNPFEGALENFQFAADFAYEWNDRIDMRAWAGRVQASYTFADLAWAPMITYSYQTFSGDDPNTARQERFDPLFYEGSPSAWSTGSKSSMVFINSNVNAHGLALRLKPTPRDTLTFRYAHIRANELRSPIQFGQATRVQFSNNVPTVVSGVVDPHLSDDFFLEYNRVINPNTFLTAGISVAVPGKGIDAVVGGKAPNWIGGFVNVVVNF